MEEVTRIRKTSIWIFIVPIVVLNLCLVVSINYHIFNHGAHTVPYIYYEPNFWDFLRVDQVSRSGFTIPYFDGNISISRTVRGYPNYLLFKPGMIITAIFLTLYWIAYNNLFKKIDENKKNKYFLFFGIGSALFLTLHSIFLGYELDSELYKFFRRFMLLGFIIFEIAAQAILLINLIRIKEKINQFINKGILRIKIILVSLLIIVALCSIPILSSLNHVHFKHALEWNYFIAIVTFYLLTFMFWKKKKT